MFKIVICCFRLSLAGWLAAACSSEMLFAIILVVPLYSTGRKSALNTKCFGHSVSDGWCPLGMVEWKKAGRPRVGGAEPSGWWSQAILRLSPSSSLISSTRARQRLSRRKLTARAPLTGICEPTEVGGAVSHVL